MPPYTEHAMTRRGFRRLAPAVPMLAIVGQRTVARVRAVFSADVEFGRGLAGLRRCAGMVVASMKTTGAVIRFPQEVHRSIDWLPRMSRNARRGH